MMLKKRFDSSVLNWIYVGIFTSSLLLLMLCFFVKTSYYNFDGESIWVSARLIPEYSYFESIAFLFVGFFIADIVLYGFSILQIITKKILWKDFNLINIGTNIIFLSIYLLLSIAISLYDSPIWVLILFTLLINGAGLVIYLLHREPMKNESSIVENTKPTKEHVIDIDENEKDELKISRFSKTGLLVINTLSIFFLFIFMFIPILTYKGEIYTLLSALSKECTIEIYAISIAMYILYIISAIFYIYTISSYRRSNTEFVIKSRNLNRVVLLTVSCNFITSMIFIFVFRIMGIESTTNSLFPLLLTLALSLVFAFFQGNINLEENKEKKKKKEIAKLSFIPLIFIVLISAVTICSIFLNFIDVNFDIFRSFNENYKFTGIELLRDYAELNEIFQVFAFIYAVALFISGAMLFLTLFSFFGKSKDYYIIAKKSAYTNFILTCILAVISLFFMFNQKIMDESIQLIFEHLDLNIGTVYSYKIGSHMIYVCLASLLILLIMLVTRQMDHKMPKKLETSFETFGQNIEDTIPSEEQGVSAVEKEFDACLAFTELDELKPVFIKNFKERQKSLFENPSLPNLVDFVVNYARESRLHLFYTFEEMATFVAGIGSSKLSILQGMSGTGKTSLPKIFMEAIMGKCDLIEVESSWRDKNELIGYYNEFSKRFTPRKFTQALYTAKLNPGIPTFIVLDEMNLSRIEYYFSDFLSLMEAEEKYREIKLLNIKIAPQGNPNKTSYFGLKNGHTLKIPSNVWFIGTANQDESTFEISDKVYDRAQTMNFNKRAAKAKINNDQIQQRFWSYEMLSKLFIEAKNSMDYDAENDVVIQEVEKLLIPYNVSFGNRSLVQIEEFVKIYCACFDVKYGSNKNQIMKDAVENVLISKVVRKLSTKQIDNIEKLARAFDKLGLSKCSSYIRTLDEA